MPIFCIGLHFKWAVLHRLHHLPSIHDMTPKTSNPNLRWVKSSKQRLMICHLVLPSYTEQGTLAIYNIVRQFECKKKKPSDYLHIVCSRVGLTHKCQQVKFEKQKKARCYVMTSVSKNKLLLWKSIRSIKAHGNDCTVADCPDKLNW